MIRIVRFAALLLLTTFTAARADEPIQFARTPAISPDGKLIAFSYLGDIWTVSASGGIARPVTMHQAQELYPIFSPDGKQLAFASKRHGGYDVYTVNVLGGKPTRLTFDSATDYPTCWSSDGKLIMFSSSRSPEYPRGYELYTVPSTGGLVRRVSASEGREGQFSPDGKSIALVRGPGAWYRKGYRGSSNNDIWISDEHGQNTRQLTRYEGNDASPMWSNDGRFLYYVSDIKGGAANIVRQPVSGGPITLVTAGKNGAPFHTEDGARKASISADGKWIVYEVAGDIMLVSTKPGSKPRKVMIQAYADEKTNSKKKVSYTSSATEFAMSPKDEKHFAFVVRGEIFLKGVSSSGSTTRLTNSPANDHGIAWAPDSSKLFFLSDRSGHEEIYRLEGNDPRTKTFTSSKRFRVTRIPNTRGASGMMVSPDGKIVSYLKDGKLWGMNPDGTNNRPLVNEAVIVDYDWSPDSKWLVYSRMDGSFATELYIVPTRGGKAVNVTRYSTSNVGVTWSKTGNKLAFRSQRPSTTNIYVLSLQKPAAKGAPSSSAIDFERIHHRVKSPTSMTVGQCAISRDGSKVAFSATSAGKTELWVVGSSGGTVTKLTSDNSKPSQITWSKRSSSVLYFKNGSGQIKMCRLPSVLKKTSTVATIPFKAEMIVDTQAEFTEMFDQGWRYLADSFYDATLHGVDWNKVRQKYRPMIKHIALKEDLYSLMYLMMGELNASHLGVSGYFTRTDESTGHLGILFDTAYRGRGMKIRSIVPRGPADKRGMNLKPGQYVVAVAGKFLKKNVNLSQLLNSKSGKTVEVVVMDNPNLPVTTKTIRRVFLAPTSRGTISSLLYEAWVEENARKVADASGGKLGYIHIPSMNQDGVNRFTRALYSDNFKKDGIIIDVRFNGGGYTHEQILNYLGSKEHTIFHHRQGPKGLVLRAYDRKWTKPVVLLINNRSYSDAEIFPNAFRTLSLGKIVGAPTGGFVIGTSSRRLIDGSSFRVPRIGVFTSKGINMEKEGVRPDVLVENLPDDLAQGKDAQLSKAVDVLRSSVLLDREKKGELTGKAPKGSSTGEKGSSTKK